MSILWAMAKNEPQPIYSDDPLGFNQRCQTIYLKVSNGVGMLDTCDVEYHKDYLGDQEYTGHIKCGAWKLFGFWGGDETIEEGTFYRNYHAADETIWRCHLAEYHYVVRHGNTGLKTLLLVLVPILNSLRDGVYSLTVRDMLPVNGNGNYFYETEKPHQLMSSSTNDWPLYNGYGSIASFPLYMVPTQSSDLTDQTRVTDEQSNSQGLGISLRLFGFDDYLVDGHSQAKAAFNRRQSFPCVSISAVYEEAVKDLKFANLADFPTNLHYLPSIISNEYFLDYLTVDDVLMIYDYFKSINGKSHSEQTELLKNTLVHGQSEDEMLRIIQGLFYSNDRSNYLKMEQTVRFDYPFQPIYRRYYGLLVNWLDEEGVKDLLMQFLIDNLSSDEQLNQFVAERLAAVM